MKKYFVLFTLVFSLFNNQAISGNAVLFQIDEELISDELSELTALENYVKAHEGLTMSLIVDEMMLDDEAGFEIAALLNSCRPAEPPLGIPSFLWGFTGALLGCCSGYGMVLGPAAVIIVYLVTDDKEEAKKALWGCIAGTAVGSVLFFFYFAAVIGLNF